MPKGYKQKLKTHVGMARGPARRRVRQKTPVWVPHWTAEVRQRCAETRIIIIIGMQVHFNGIQVKFVYEGHRVKVKVTGYHTVYRGGLCEQVARPIRRRTQSGRRYDTIRYVVSLVPRLQRKRNGYYNVNKW